TSKSRMDRASVSTNSGVPSPGRAGKVVATMTAAGRAGAGPPPASGPGVGPSDGRRSGEVGSGSGSMGPRGDRTGAGDDGRNDPGDGTASATVARSRMPVWRRVGPRLLCAGGGRSRVFGVMRPQRGHQGTGMSTSTLTVTPAPAGEASREFTAYV